MGVKSKVPSAFSVTEPLATTTGVPTTTAMPSIAVMARPAFSKLSLPTTAMLTVVSSFVVIVSLTISTTAATVTLTVDCVTLPSPSSMLMMKLSLP
ncbi:hypothetical protein LMG5911_05760 [Achromobacter spanius]|nr:hypothetical protein LMG5911_05760 [Achromobacter spanius]